MIKSIDDYKQYLLQDKKMLGRKTNKPKHGDYIWKYEILLRKCELYYNCKKGFVNRLVYTYYKYKRHKLGIMLGYSIPLNVFGPGLSIAHIGPIVINSGSVIGQNCRIHVCVNIGTEAGKTNQAPSIGDNCYIGPGAKIFGNITIGNNVAIGANAVVNKSFKIDNVSIAGVPAKVISQKGSKDIIKC